MVEDMVDIMVDLEGDIIMEDSVMGALDTVEASGMDMEDSGTIIMDMDISDKLRLKYQFEQTEWHIKEITQN